jgi:hypothetical protein
MYHGSALMMGHQNMAGHHNTNHCPIGDMKLFAAATDMVSYTITPIIGPIGVI